MTPSSNSLQNSASPALTPGLPPLYRSPVVLRFEQHRDLCVKPAGDYSFARDVNAVPISVGEFMPAIRNYPIVFAEGSLTPVAILGLKQGENRFLTAGGAWRRDAYIPAYLRRYPFIFTQIPGSDRRILTVDESSARLVELADADPEWRLFTDDGVATPMARGLLDFCETFYREQKAGEAFVTALKEADLLVSKSADMTFADQSTYQLRGFRIVDPERFQKLPGVTITDWHAKGWLNAIALHLSSQQNWRLMLADHQAKPEAVQ